jgi:tetratricopeptide (TPR) repeat protein
MDGRFDAARELYRRSRAILEEMGWKLYAALTSLDSGPIEMLAGDPVAAEVELRRDYDALREMGERNYVATTAGLLAEALYEQSRYDEAEELSRFSEEVAVADDVASQVHWRSVRAKVLARRERQDEALELANEAVRLVLQTDEMDSQGTALLDLAEVLALAGRTDDAIGSVRQAQEIFEAKGNVVSEARARGLVNALIESTEAMSDLADAPPRSA